MISPSVLAFAGTMTMPWPRFNTFTVAWFTGAVVAACVASTALIAPRLVKYGAEVMFWFVMGSIVANGVIGGVAVGWFWLLTTVDV